MTQSTEVGPTAELAVRRRPAQARSRERFGQVLTAAGELIAERGLGPVTMTDIAERAGMAVTAVYRYFPSRQAVVRELAMGSFAADAEFLAVSAGSRTGPPGQWLAGAVQEYCLAQADDRLRLQVRAAVQGDAELSALDLQDSRRNAAFVAGALRDAGIKADQRDLERRALIVVELVHAVVRLASQLSREERGAVIAEFAGAVPGMLVPGSPPVVLEAAVPPRRSAAGRGRATRSTPSPAQ